MKSYHKGLLAERIVMFYLILKGHKIIKYRFKTKLGEIDIISLRKKQLHFIEVKYRKNKDVFIDVINYRQQKRIKNTALLFLQKKSIFQNLPFSFDVVFVSFPFYLKYIYNSFS